MELGAAALADRLEGDRTLGKFRAVRIGQNRNLLYLVLINVGGLRSLVARVEQVGAVGRHGHGAIHAAALNRVLADRAGIALCRHCSLAKLALGETVIDRRPRHDLNQLCRIAPVQRDILDHAFVQRLAGRSGVGRHLHVAAGNHNYFFLRGLDSKDNRGETQSRSLVESDTRLFVSRETWRGDRESIARRQDRREIKVSGVVRDRVTKCASSLVFQYDFRMGNHRACGVGDGGANRTARKLGERGQLTERSNSDH